jgi:hypothetical protein
MSTDCEIHPGSLIAAIGIHGGFRVYFQDYDGYMRESRQKDRKWSGVTFKDTLFRAKLESPLAVTTWKKYEVTISPAPLSRKC